MELRIQNLVDNIVDIVKGWDAVEAITLVDHEKDPYDPYFFLSIDVYLSNPSILPPRDERERAFHFAGAFETSPNNKKDRFISHELPVRLEYKSCQRIDQLTAHASPQELRDNSTYVYYRLTHAQLLHSRGHWIDRIRQAITQFPDRFWELLREETQTRMEHHLSDLGAAVAREDEFFFIASLAGFASAVVSCLFAINKQFHPSDRKISDALVHMDFLPDGFAGLFASLIRQSDGHMHRKWELAGLLAKKVINL